MDFEKPASPTPEQMKTEKEETEEVQKENVTEKESTENPKEEAYDFSKEFSKHGRLEMAQQIRRVRREYMKDIPAENEKRAEERTTLEEKRGSYEKRIDEADRGVAEVTKEHSEWLAAQKELEQLKEAIEKRKSSIWYKVQRTFGGGSDVSEKETLYYNKKNEVGNFDEYRVTKAEEERKYAENGRDMMAYYDRQIADVEDIVIDEAWHDKARAQIGEFYGKQDKIKNEWENDSADRGIQENSEKHNVLFLHGIPFERQMANTSMNNGLIDTETMSSEDKVRFIAGLEPTLSVSSKTLDANLAQNMPTRGEVIYETGLIIGNGKIMSAYGEDAGLVAENLKIKRAKSGDSSIQIDITEHIAKSVGVGDRDDNVMTIWNEFAVQNPEIAGMYIMEGAENEEAALPRIQKLADEMKVPVIRISRDGKMFNLNENRETTREEILANKAKFSTEEKVGFIEQTKKFVREDLHPEMAEEIQKRLNALKAEKTEAEQLEEDAKAIEELYKKIRSTAPEQVIA